jgi:hypothetical protein
MFCSNRFKSHHEARPHSENDIRFPYLIKAGTPAIAFSGIVLALRPYQNNHPHPWKIAAWLTESPPAGAETQ